MEKTDQKKTMSHLLPVNPTLNSMGDIFHLHRDYVNEYILPLLHKKDPLRWGKFTDIAQLSSNQRVELTKEMIHAIHDECSEILGWLPWKHWKRYDGYTIDVDEIRFEIIDLLHFVNNLGFIWGMTFEDMKNYYEAKLKENINRQEEKY